MLLFGIKLENNCAKFTINKEIILYFKMPNYSLK